MQTGLVTTDQQLTEKIAKMLLQAEPDIKQNLFDFFSKSGDNQNEINTLLFTLASQTFLESFEENKELEDRLTELEEKVAANEKDHASRLDLAIALNAAGKREEAADHLLEIMRLQPGWNEDAAKTQLLQFFEAWGLTDETTVSARRKLSSLLFSQAC